MLNNKYGAKGDQILFDFNYILEALIKASQNHQKYSPILVGAYSKFIALYNSEAPRFQFRTAEEEKYLACMWDIFADFYLANSQLLQASPELDLSLSLIIIKSKYKAYHNGEIIKYFQSSSNAVEVLINLIFTENTELPLELIDLVLMLCKEFFLTFWSKSESCQLVYTILIVLKRNNFQRLLEGSWLELDCKTVMNKLKNCRFEDELIVALRLLSFFNLQFT